MEFMKLKYYIMLGSLFLLASCDKEIDVETPDFNIIPDKTTAQAGEQILFTVQGNADIISFYSGEPTRDYAFREGRIIDVANDDVTLEFSSAVTGGSQEDQLTFLASTDFNGNYDDLESVKSATWIDITDRFTFGSSSSFVSSSQDISDLLEPGKPIYFAFRYVTLPQEENGLARTWMIQNFSLNSKKQFNDSELTIANQVYSGFRIVDQDPVNTPSRSTITTTRVSLLGNEYQDPEDPKYDPENPIYDPENPIYDPESEEYDPAAERPTFVPYDPDSPYNDPQTENWAVSKAIYIDKVDLGPDHSTPIKGISNPKLEEFSYSYEKAGEYKAYFIATNSTINGKKDVIKEFNFTINP
jgi:hypothetical protein